MGQSFSAGTTDGPGVDGSWQGPGNGSRLLDSIANILQYILAPGQSLPAATDAIKACQAPKHVLLATGEYTFPYPWQPSRLPLQIFLISRKLVIIGHPGEITTMAGRRLRNAVLEQVVKDGSVDGDAVAVIAGLSNIYSSYLTTFEEYQMQRQVVIHAIIHSSSTDFVLHPLLFRYEAGSTIFGQHSLQAFTTLFTRLASTFSSPSSTESLKYLFAETSTSPFREGSYKELYLNNNLVHKILTDAGDYGAPVSNVANNTIFKQGDVVDLTFQCSHPRNHAPKSSFVEVQHFDPLSSAWTTILQDGHWDLKFMWKRTGGPLSPRSSCSITWRIGESTQVSLGLYRIKIHGTAQNILNKKREWTGVSQYFTVV